jgi:UDP-2,3-diacylglucosamine hydrolase
MSKPDVIVSDLHLGAVPADTERNFVRFLERIGSDAASLLIAGDLFDFWFEYRTVVPGEHFRVLAALAALVDAGVAVTLAGGNHDAWGGAFLRDEVGITFHDRPFHTTLAGAATLVAHGDGLGSGDFRYRALKAIVRSPLTIGVFRWIHPDLGMRMARAVSRTETRDADASMQGRATFLRQWALAQFAADTALRYVVCGHSHIPEIVAAGDGRYYLNAGDWIRHYTYITLAPGGAPVLEHWGQAARP